jgi:hypothetical protein
VENIWSSQHGYSMEEYFIIYTYIRQTVDFKVKC